jgi:hypothetical protein
VIPAIPGQIVGLTPENPAFELRREVDGVPLPDDLWDVVHVEGGRMLEHVRQRLTTTPWTFCPDEWSQAERDAWRPMGDDQDWQNLGAFLDSAIMKGFFLALVRYSEHLASVAEVSQFLQDRAENGEMATAEMREKKKKPDAERADIVCKLWGRVRSSFPDGRWGNNPALKAVAERYKGLKHSSISTRAIRNILKRRGICMPK